MPCSLSATQQARGVFIDFDFFQLLNFLVLFYHLKDSERVPQSKWDPIGVCFW